MGISIVIFIWAAGLLKDATIILLETAPKGMDIDTVSLELKKKFPEIQDIYDMHIWAITTNMYSFTAQISFNSQDYEKNKEFLPKIKEFLSEKYGITHSTIEIS